MKKERNKMITEADTKKVVMKGGKPDKRVYYILGTRIEAENLEEAIKKFKSLKNKK